MSELIPFSSIDWDSEGFTPEQHEAAEFLHKMDWEGGIDGLIGYGGWRYFPEELQDLARKYESIHNELRTAIDIWAAERGVEY